MSLPAFVYRLQETIGLARCGALTQLALDHDQLLHIMLDGGFAGHHAAAHPVVSGETGKTRLVRRIVRQMELGNARGLGELQGLRGRLRRVLNDEKRVHALRDEVLNRCDLLRRSPLSDDVEDGPAFALRKGLEDLKARLVEVIGGVHVVADDLGSSLGRRRRSAARKGQSAERDQTHKLECHSLHFTTPLLSRLCSVLRFQTDESCISVCTLPWFCVPPFFAVAAALRALAWSRFRPRNSEICEERSPADTAMMTMRPLARN